MKKMIFKYLLAFFLLAFAAYIHLNSTHDWGGDFAQYIHQGKNILQGAANTKTHIYNQQFSMNGPEFFPMGFSIILAPFYYFFGNNILVFALVVCTLLLLSYLGYLRLFDLRYSFIPALIIVLVAAFDPWLIIFKQEVVSDIPFAFFVLLSLWGLTYIKKYSYIGLSILGVILGFTILVRTIGIAFYPAMFFYFLYRRELVYRYLMVSIISIIFVLLANGVVFSTSASSYLDNIDLSETANCIKTNALIFYKIIKGKWPKGEYLRLFANLLRNITIPLLLVGFIYKLYKNFTLSDLFVCFYMLILLVWPAQNGWRMLLPIFPLILEYCFVGFSLCRRLLKFSILRYSLTFIVLFSLFMCYAISYRDTFTLKELFTIDDSKDGPYNQENYSRQSRFKKCSCM